MYVIPMLWLLLLNAQKKIKQIYEAVENISE